MSYLLEINCLISDHHGWPAVHPLPPLCDFWEQDVFKCLFEALACRWWFCQVTSGWLSPCVWLAWPWPWWLLLMAAFCWAKWSSFGFYHSRLTICIWCDQWKTFAFQTFAPLFNSDLSFALRRSCIAGRELLLWKEIAVLGWLVWPCCVWMVGKKNGVWV